MNVENIVGEKFFVMYKDVIIVAIESWSSHKTK
jgi:hypothetical protein